MYSVDTDARNDQDVERNITVTRPVVDLGRSSNMFQSEKHQDQNKEEKI